MNPTPDLSRARALFEQGHQAFAQGRLEQAERLFAEALTHAPGRPSLLANLGLTRHRRGRWAEAVEPLTQAVAADPNHAEAWLALGGCHEALGRWEPAVAALQRGLGPLPTVAPAWLSLARCQLALHAPEAALAAVTQALAHDPALAPAWTLRGQLLREQGRRAEAATCFERALELGAEPDLHRFFLASVRDDAAPVPEHAPRAYVETLFDDYAGSFGTHLVQALGYQGHETLLAPLRAEGRRWPWVLDLGCGTGLCGRLIAPQAGALEGVDLSAAMVAQARASGVYRRVWHGDLMELLGDGGPPADLVMAADVFIYVGALEAVFAAVRARLAPGGRFVFSVEQTDPGQDGLVLRPSLRYAHGEAYVRGLAAAHGFTVRRADPAPLRRDQGRAVMGWYWALEPKG